MGVQLVLNIETRPLEISWNYKFSGEVYSEGLLS